MTAGTIARLLDECGTSRPDRPLLRDVVDDFPLTGLGKVAKAELARQIAGGTR